MGERIAQVRTDFALPAAHASGPCRPEIPGIGGQTFPTPNEGFRINESLARIAVITFFTVFKSGREDDGRVAGNGREAIKRFREVCLERAFSEPEERAVFDALYKRLEQARDGLLAHDDGSAQEMEQYGNISSFRPQDGGVAPEDAGLLLVCAERLLAAVKSMCALPPPG